MAKLVDLTGATVRVPSGWSASAGYKELYSLNYDLYSYNNDSTYSSTMLGIGFRGFDVDEFKFRFPVDNYIFTGQPTLLGFNNTDHLRFYFYGGKDVTNTNLIQWFIDNNATIEGGVWEEEETGIPVTLANSYILATSDGATFLVIATEDDIPEDPSSPNVTDLTNTKWQFIYDLTGVTEGITINVDFTSNGSVFNKIMFEPGTGLMFFDSNNNNYIVYSILDGVGVWANLPYRNIHITGGADVTNATAISYLLGVTYRQIVSSVVYKFLIKNPLTIFTSTMRTDGNNLIVNAEEVEVIKNVNLITFTIDGTQYSAEDGMTWEQWCNSNYNTYGYAIDYNGYIAAGVGHDYVAFSDSLVESDDVIINNRSYTHYDIGTGGSN